MSVVFELERRGFRPQRIRPRGESPDRRYYLASCPVCVLPTQTLSLWMIDDLVWPCCWNQRCAGYYDPVIILNALIAMTKGAYQ